MLSGQMRGEDILRDGRGGRRFSLLITHLIYWLFIYFIDYLFFCGYCVVTVKKNKVIKGFKICILGEKAKVGKKICGVMGN